METVAELLWRLGFLLYGGPIVAFAILVSAASRIPDIQPWEIVRTYRCWGPGLGLSLGAAILGGLTGHYLTHGSFTWAWSSPVERWELATWLCFFLLWVSNLKLEVWTLEPLRKLDRSGQIEDPEAYREGVRPLSRHLVVQAVLVVAVVCCEIVYRSLQV